MSAPSFTTGHEPSPAELQFLVPRLKVKSVDESLTTNTTLQTDDELTLALGLANTYYRLVLNLTQNSPGAAGFKIGANVPSGLAVVHGWFTCGSSAATEQMGLLGTSFSIAGITGTGSDALVHVEALLLTGSTTGNFVLTWAQNAASGTSTVKAGSNMELRPVG